MSEPQGHWLLGHVPAIRKDPLGLLDACREPAARLWLGRPAWLLLEPADIEHVLASDEIYSKGQAFRYGRRLYGNSLLVSEGEDHRQQARLIGGLFLRHAARDFLDPAPAIADQLASRWQPGEAIDLYRAMMALTLAISSRAIFGQDWLPAWMPEGSAEAGKILSAFDTAMGHVARQNFSVLAWPDWLPVPSVLRYRRAIETLDRAFDESHRRRQQGTARGGFLDHLIEAADSGGAPLPTAQIRDQSLVLLLGGYESTATALTWTLLLLSAHPEIRQRLIDEVEGAVGDRLPAAEDVDRLPWTAQVVSESLRLYPPPWLIPRTAERADALPSGLRVDSGALLFLSPYRTQRDARFFPDPLRFDPARFEAAPTWPSGAYFPFGGGPRRCIGESVSRKQVTLILAALCRRWQFEPEGEPLPRPRPLLTLRPPLDLRVRVRPARP
jgi:cytochrome P450